ncbi:helix-turn-helix transcriptional regulator [Delftia tsuruhatensis]|uniref:helix-turn-helix domain-containing protein n=1 Tax=Delftia tsuruhatensis TaxID=180282 RepID=UPI00301DA82D
MEFVLLFREHLALHLRSLRRASGLTQVQLGGALGLSQSRIAVIEADPTSISVRQLLEVLDAVQCDVVLRPRQAGRVRNDDLKPGKARRSRGRW